MRITSAQIIDAAPDIIVMSWCGVKVAKYRPDVVRGRDGWADVPAIQHDQIHPISEEFMGRPGPRVVQGYQALCPAIAAHRAHQVVGAHD